MKKKGPKCNHLLVGGQTNHVTLEGGDVRVASAVVCYLCHHVFRMDIVVPHGQIMAVAGYDIRQRESKLTELGVMLAWYLIGRHQRRPPRVEQVWGEIPGGSIITP